jgi:phosphate starvation-inducible PhoH-like protein
MELTVDLDYLDEIACVFGSFDENIRKVEKEYDVLIINRGDAFKISGEADQVFKAQAAINGLISLAERGSAIDDQLVRYVIGMVNEGNTDQIPELHTDCICITSRGKPIKPKTIGQKQYVGAIHANTITLGVGPAGTGKTYLAVAMAVQALRKKEIDRIILTRPAVEAGEKLGFLPGDLQNKVDPYLRPLHDALFDMLGIETYQKYLELGRIEIAPLAYMRGRTLDGSYIILDEAQNTTPQQMKMFLTRLGFGSKVVITGDITQIDLPSGVRPGLKEAIRVLRNIEDIGIVNLTERDVVRHKLVSQIIKAYEKYEQEKPAPKRYARSKSTW